MRRDRIAGTIVAVTIATTLLVGAAGCSSSSGGDSGSGGLAPSSDPEIDKGRTLIEAKCDLCHTLDRIETAQKDADGWKTTVDRMRKQGAVLTDEEAQQIIDYLAAQ